MAQRRNLMQMVLTLEIGGLEKLVFQLVEKLDSSKYNLSVCSLSPGGGLANDFRRMGVPVYHIEKGDGVDWFLSFRLMRLLKRENIHIIHTHNHTPWLYGAIAARLAGVERVVHTEHSNVLSGRTRMILAEWVVSQMTDVVISDSQKVACHLKGKQRINPLKIKTILNGIDVGRFQKTVDITKKRRALGLSPGNVIIGNVARLEPVKDHVYLLKIFKRVSARFPKAVLVIVGDGGQAQSLKHMAKAMKLDEKVIFLGTRDDIPELMRVFDIFILTSVSEGLSLSILEAMAAGKTIVATDVGGNPEVVSDGRTGILIPRSNPEKAAEMLSDVLTDKESLVEMGQAGRKRVNELFDVGRMVREYERVYDG